MMRNLGALFSFASVLCGLGGFVRDAHAGSTPDMEAISVTGSRLPVKTLPGSLDVIDAELIETWNNWSVTDLLRHISGVDISKPGGAGAAELFVRGAEANFATVLIDGVRVNNPANSRGGSYDFSIVDVGSVDRIEIIRGPVSAVYGADALSGVVNIITQDAGKDPFVALGGDLGTHEYSRMYARAAAPLSDQLSGSLFAAHSNAPEAIDGYTARLNTFQGGLDYSFLSGTREHRSHRLYL
jgi:vitamin B12 transporter